MWRPDLIEALVRAGRAEEAEAQLAVLERQAAATGGRWARAAALRGRGLLAAEDGFRAPFEQALALHADVPMPFEEARTQLAYGKRLRRAKARADARAPLDAARATFARLGATAWLERAQAELRATGQSTGARAPAASAWLTAHELQVALHIAQGMTNREAAAALFVSPKTVEYHLGQIYRKLEVRGRSQLARLMALELPEGERPDVRPLDAEASRGGRALPWPLQWPCSPHRAGGAPAWAARCCSSRWRTSASTARPAPTSRSFSTWRATRTTTTP